MRPDLLRARMADPGWAKKGLGGDFAIGDRPDLPAEAVLLEAAVLMAVTSEAEPQLLLTRRTAHLKRHAGQIAFPGGRADAGDTTPVMTALREAEEEVALARDQVEVLGQLDPYLTGTGFRVRAVVGLVPPGLVLVPEPGEVAEVFHVPLGYVLDPANHEMREREFQGRAFRYYAISHGGREIWGATAGMIVNLARRLG